jgi:hypothetical protein
VRHSTLAGLAAAFTLVAGASHAAIVTQSFALTASGFEAGAPVEPVTGLFTFTYDSAAFLTPPSAVGLTISDFNVAYAGPALFQYTKGSNLLIVGNNIGLGSFTIAPGTPGFGFAISNVSTTPTISSFTYSADGHLWHAANVSLTAVPEPQTWSLLIAGFGLAGAGLRLARRNRGPGFATA